MDNKLSQTMSIKRKQNLSPPPVKSKLVDINEPSLFTLLEEFQAVCSNTDNIAAEIKICVKIWLVLP